MLAADVFGAQFVGHIQIVCGRSKHYHWPVHGLNTLQGPIDDVCGANDNITELCKLRLSGCTEQSESSCFLVGPATAAGWPNASHNHNSKCTKSVLPVVDVLDS